MMFYEVARKKIKKKIMLPQKSLKILLLIIIYILRINYRIKLYTNFVLSIQLQYFSILMLAPFKRKKTANLH